MKWISSLLMLFIISSTHAGEGRDAYDQFMTGLTTLEARFEQTVLNQEQSQQGLFYGTFLLKRPGRFRWDYLGEESKRIIADGSDLWILEDDLEQITQYSQSLVLEDTPASIFLSEKDLEEQYTVVEVGEHRGLQWLELIPLDEDDDVTRVLLAFKDKQLLQFELTDKFSQISRFSFFDLKRNTFIEDAQFTFDPPEDWDLFQF